MRYSGDLKSLQNYVTRGIIRATSDMVLLCLAVIVMFWLDWTAAAVVTGGITFVVLAVYLLNKWLYNVSVKRRNTRSGLLAFVNERLGAVLSIKSFNKEVTEQGKFEKRSSKLYASGVEYQAVYNAIFTLVPGLLYAALGVALWLISKQETSGLNEGALLAFILLFITVLPVFRRMLRVPSTWKVGNISFDKLLKILYLSSEKDRTHRVKFNYKGGEIELRNVGFSYGSSKVFSNLSVHAKPKTTGLIKAEPGFGKTTLIKLMMGIYEPETGTVKVDGQDVATLDLKTLRKHITVVSNEFQLFGRTVFEAISYSRKDEKKAPTQAMLDRLQNGLPERQKLTLDDKTGELGANLSQSQRKLMQYARAFLTGKSILLIESPFEALSEIVGQNINQLLSERQGEITLVLLDSSEPKGVKVDEIVELEY